MGLKNDTVERHIKEWQERLSDSRENWPPHLFRHEPLDNAVRILKKGLLLSRVAATANALISNDIAPNDIINSSGQAHKSVRLYFRPKNPTQYRIEGIRKTTEYYHDKHAPILIIFVFTAREILTQKNVLFSDGNMQSSDSTVFHTDDDFQQLPFDQIYHEGRFDPNLERHIIRRRCAEVLVPSPLNINQYLQFIYCRSDAERKTLLYSLGQDAPLWKDKIKVYLKAGLFQDEYAYVTSVDVNDSGVTFKLHPRRDGKSVSVFIKVTDSAGKTIVAGPIDINPKPNKGIRLKANIQPGRYKVQIKLENCLAYEAELTVENDPF